MHLPTKTAEPWMGTHGESRIGQGIHRQTEIPSTKLLISTAAGHPFRPGFGLSRDIQQKRLPLAEVAGYAGGWPTFGVLVLAKVGTHAPLVGIFI